MNLPLKMELKLAKFQKQMEMGFDVEETLKQTVYDQFTRSVGDDSVFSVKKGSPKILKKFVDHPSLLQ
jgi:hypothetical protein